MKGAITVLNVTNVGAVLARETHATTESVPSFDDYTAILLEPAWVPFTPEEIAERAKRTAKQKARDAKKDDRPGPNGEKPDSGKWRLLLPDGTVYRGPTVSPSAAETATECLHKWALPRLDDEEKPPNRKADMGGERHSELEGWLKHGTQPTTDGMSKVIQHFPMPGQCESEVYFGFLFGLPGREVVFAGWIDVREPGVIRDLKTTGDFKWKKTAAQLRANFQACVYGFGEMLRQSQRLRKEVYDVVLKWTYAQIKEPGVITRVETVNENDSTKDPKLATGVLLTREQALVTLVQYLPVAETMLEAIAAGKKAKDMPKTASSCELYGGCPFKKSGACEMPSGGGFMAQMKQERIRLGIEGIKPIGNEPKLKASIESNTTNTKKESTKMNMAARFGKKTGTSTGTTAALKVVPKEAPVKEQASAPAPTSGTGLGARFAKKTGVATSGTVAAKPQPTPAAAAGPNKVDVKVTEKGAASTAPSATGTSTAPKSGALMSRLKAIVKPEGAAAVEAALEKAPTHAVTEAGSVAAQSTASTALATASGAVGINPPDVAPEWTQEEQAAEAAKIAARSGGDKSDGAKTSATKSTKKSSTAAVTAAATAIAVGATTEQLNQAVDQVVALVEKKGRGRPKGSTNAADVYEATSDVISELDEIAMKCMRSGERKAAAAILRAIEEIGA